MASCEKCWGDAYNRSRGNGKSQTENYNDLLKERENKPCSPEEQVGLFMYESIEEMPEWRQEQYKILKKEKL